MTGDKDRPVDRTTVSMEPMSIFAIALILIIMIPIMAIIFDSKVGDALARRISSGEGDEKLTPRLDALEAEIRYLSETVESLSEESTFLRALIEGAPEPPRLEPGGETQRLGADD